MSDFISIGLITRNRGNILHSAIEQLLSQSYKNIELIISDNASTDTTEEVCRKYQKKDKRVVYYRQQKNLGMYGNFNFVLNKAKGKYFMWATDDDVWDVDCVKILVSLFKKYPDSIVVTCNYTFFKGDRKVVYDYDLLEYIPWLKAMRAYIGKGVNISYGLIKTSYLQKSGGFYRYPFPIPDGVGDTVSSLKLLLLGGGVAFSRKALFLKNDSGVSLELFDMLKELKITKVLYRRLSWNLRYYPLLHIYDIVLCTFFIFTSRLNFKNKVDLSYWYFLYNSWRMKELLLNYVKGSFFLLKGITAKLFG